MQASGARSYSDDNREGTPPAPVVTGSEGYGDPYARGYVEHPPS